MFLSTVIRIRQIIIGTCEDSINFFRRISFYLALKYMMCWIYIPINCVELKYK